VQKARWLAACNDHQYDDQSPVLMVHLIIWFAIATAPPSVP
jgi:hypothetical protein